MKLFNIKGRLVKKNVTKYLVDWEGKCRSKFQQEVKQFLKPYWQKYIVYEEFPVYGSKMKIDILNASKKIAVEVQGVQHSEFNEFFHDNSRIVYWKSIKRDSDKLQWLEKNGFTLLEIYPDDLPKLTPDYIQEKLGIDIL